MIRSIALIAIFLSGCASGGDSSRVSRASSSDADCAAMVDRYQADYDIEQKRIDELVATSNDGPLISQAIAAGVQASADLAEAERSCGISGSRDGW